MPKRCKDLMKSSNHVLIIQNNIPNVVLTAILKEIWLKKPLFLARFTLIAMDAVFYF